MSLFQLATHEELHDRDYRSDLASPIEDKSDLAELGAIMTSPQTEIARARELTGGPRTYVWLRSGCRGIKIYLRTAPADSEYSAGYDCSPTGSPKQSIKTLSTNDSQSKGKVEVEEKNKSKKKKKGKVYLGLEENPSYSLKMAVKHLTLYTGDGTLKKTKCKKPDPSAEVDDDVEEKKEEEVPIELPKPVIDGDIEGFFSCTSTFWDHLTGRNVNMFRATRDMGMDRDGILSRRRTFVDFDGYKYKWSTAVLGGQTVSGRHEDRLSWDPPDDPSLYSGKCVRLLDGTTVATFRRAFHPKRIGEMTLHQAVPEKTLQLLLATCAACFSMQRRREEIAKAIAGGAGAGG